MRFNRTTKVNNLTGINSHVNWTVQHTDRVNLSLSVHTAYSSCLWGASVPVTSHNVRAGLNLEQILKLHPILLLGARYPVEHVHVSGDMKFSALLLEQLLSEAVAGEEIKKARKE